MFRRLFPVRPPDPSEPPLTDEERKTFHRWEMASIIPIFLFTAAFGSLWYLAMKEAAGLWPTATPATRFLLRPEPISFAAPALILGILSSALPIDGLYRLLLRERYRRFERACHERVGFDGDRALILIAVVFLPSIVALFYLIAANAVRFTDSGIEIARPIPFRSRSHAYRQVRAIEHWMSFRAPSGNIVHRPYYAILFDDGDSWTTEDICQPSPRVAEAVIRLVAEKSGRDVVERP